MNDLILEAISANQIGVGNISFSKLRECGKRNLDIWGELGRGRAVLSSLGQLDQYLYSYGLMIQTQWEGFLPNVSLPSGSIVLIDYGCGQGLGSALLFDHFGSALVSCIKSITLIEPSEIALTRAKAILECYCPGAIFSLINKKFDDVSNADIPSDQDCHYLHVFSNVLDINGFDCAALFTKMFSVKGSHTVLAVSHDRNFEGGNDTIEDLDRQVKDPEHNNWFSLRSSQINKFISSNGTPTITWEIHLDVLNGSV